MFSDSPVHPSFSVDHLAPARQFYGETLGLGVTDDVEIGHLMTLQVAGGHDVLVYEKPDHVPATFTVLNFEVPDIDAAVDALAAKGVAFERYDGFGQDDRAVLRGRGPSIAWFRDPAGNILSVVQSRDDS